jgi:short subunit dehydrogenase-like uncharacterized protein
MARATLRMPVLASGPGRRVRRVSRGLHRDARFGWAVPLPSADLEIALRSAHALEAYGPDVSFELYLSVPRLDQLIALGLLAGSVVALSQLAWTRRVLTRLVPAGSGPDAGERAKNWFKLCSRAESEGRTIVTEVSGGDPAYDETAKMLSESALCLVHDRDGLPQTAGVLTPACAFGDVLLARLVRAGLVFRVVSS